MTNATLIITRKSGYNAVLREAAVLVDGQKVGVVGNGKSIEIPLAPGHHAICTRMDWVKSPEIKLDAVAGARYSVELSFCNSFLALFAILGFLPYMKLTPR